MMIIMIITMYSYATGIKLTGNNLPHSILSFRFRFSYNERIKTGL